MWAFCKNNFFLSTILILNALALAVILKAWYIKCGGAHGAFVGKAALAGCQ